MFQNIRDLLVAITKFHHFCKVCKSLGRKSPNVSCKIFTIFYSQSLYRPVWKNNSDQTCSCPRDERLSASSGPIEDPSYFTVLSYWEVKGGPFLGPPLYREAPVSRTADARICSLRMLIQYLFQCRAGTLVIGRTRG